MCDITVGYSDDGTGGDSGSKNFDDRNISVIAATLGAKRAIEVKRTVAKKLATALSMTLVVSPAIKIMGARVACRRGDGLL